MTVTSSTSTATLPAHRRGLDAAALAGDRFEIKRHLGSGASKDVFLAVDRTLRREVAFALIAGGGPRGSSRERVLDEVRTTARLEHPHIVTVYDVRDTADATIVVSRLVRGGSAADWAARATPGARRVQTAVEIARQVASALAHAHADGVIHRDVKPSNILLAPDGTALLADFGVALLAGSATDAGGAVGSLAYMPPEQAAGAAVDARSDLYALGATLFELAEIVDARPADRARGQSRLSRRHAIRRRAGSDARRRGDRAGLDRAGSCRSSATSTSRSSRRRSRGCCRSIRGRLDYVALPSTLAPNVLDGDSSSREYAKRGIALHRHVAPSVAFFFFNLDHPLVGGYTPEKIALRRAISMGYDREGAISSSAQRPGAFPRRSPCRRRCTATIRIRAPYGYDPRAARALLDKFGYKDRDGDGYRETARRQAADAACWPRRPTTPRAPATSCGSATWTRSASGSRSSRTSGPS